MNENHLHNPDEALTAPPRLVEALKKLPREEIFVPPQVDRTIAAAARERLEPDRAARRVFPRWLLWPALATCAFFVVFAGVQTWHAKSPAFAREDLNHDGRVDILDAFALARQLRDGQAASHALDFNGDGIIDRRDTDILAARAVKLEKGGRS